MNIYRILRDTHIEAVSAAQAEEILQENNGVAAEEYFVSLDDASARFSEIKATLARPHDLGYHAGKHLYWFEGVAMEVGNDCDEPEEGDTLRDAFNTAASWDGIYVAIADNDD